MKYLHRFLLGCLVVAAGGCGVSAQPLAAPVDVQGRIIGADGKPVGKVIVNLQPMENGYMQSIDVAADGTFSVQTHAGKYAWSIAPAQGNKKLPANLTGLSSTSLERTVVVTPDKPLEIVLP